MEEPLLRIGDGESTRDAGGDWNDDGEYAGEEQEMEKLEEEVREVSEKVKKYRSTLPATLNSTLSSILVSQRRTFSLSSDSSSEPGPSRRSCQGQGFQPGNSYGILPTEDDERSEDDVRLLEEKISHNISTMPIF